MGQGEGELAWPDRGDWWTGARRASKGAGSGARRASKGAGSGARRASKGFPRAAGQTANAIDPPGRYPQ